MTLRGTPLVLAGLLSACLATASPSANDVALPQLGTPEIELPGEYLLNHGGRDWQSTDAEWVAGASAEASTSTCGEEVMWVWSDRAPSSDAVGDPAIHLFVCNAGSAGSAQEELTTVPIELTVVPQLEGIYRPVAVSTDELGLTADGADLACVWGEPSRCRAWAYAAAYDKYVINTHFVIAGREGGLAEELFTDLVASVDKWAEQHLRE